MRKESVMKKLFFLLLSLALLSTLFCGCVKESPEPIYTPPVIAPEDREKLGQMDYAGLVFDLYNDKSCELVAPSETATHEKTLIVPDFCDDYVVTAVCKNAFEGSEFTHVTLPESVKSIGDYAFRKSSICEITLPKSLEKIGVECFDNCLNLEKVTFQSSIESIPLAAFYGCEKLKEIVLPEGVKEIGEEAFAALKGLEKLTLPESLEKIGPYAFWNSGTESLEITVPKGVKEIGEDAFASSKAKITYLNEEVK